MTNLERIRGAISFIPAADRETWVRVGMAIKSELGDGGFELWDAWSQQADSYNAKDARDVWRSLNGTGGVTSGTLFHEAKARGWRDDGTYQSPSPEELSEWRRIAAERASREEAEKARERALFAELAAEIWGSPVPAGHDHHYLTRKRIKPHGVREYHGDMVICGMRMDGWLVVPMRDVDGKLWSLQFIAGDGTKRFLPGGRVQGCYFSIGRPDGAICICEGFASGATIHQATGHAVAVAFSAGNLKSVALALRMKYPEAKMIVCADNDRFTAGNPGVTKAREAALAVHGHLAVPRFDDIGPYDYYQGGEANG